MESINSFGYWLRRRRKALDLTQDALARQAGCALGTLKKVETDERRPSRQLAERLADCLAIPATERIAFLKAARAELATDQLAIATPAIETTAIERLPGGTITFLFTDIEASTALWQRHAQAMPDALARHEAILRQAIVARGGVVFKTVGDAVCAAFASAPQALAAALDAQRALQAEAWDTFANPETTQPTIQNPQSKIAVRMALHTGTAELRAGDYAGFALSRVARILAAGHGGQVLLSQSAHELVRNHLPHESALRDLGAHRLRDLNQPERIFQLVAPGVRAEFPPLRTVDIRLNNLPAQPTALIGREREIAAVGDLLRRDDVRLLTLTGPGGTGKTRLAIQVAVELALTPSPSPVATGEGSTVSATPPHLPHWDRETGDVGRFPDGIFFVNLAPIGDPSLVTTTIAHTLGLVETADKPIEARLRAFLGTKQLLLLLDNFEQVLDAAPLVADLLAAAPGLKVLVTSRATLHLYGEHEFAVPPLALPPRLPLALAWERGSGGEGDLTQYEAVRLFIARARAAKADFTVTNANAPAVAEICHRLDGLPLAIELAAARIKQFAPDALLARLSQPLALLTGGPRDLPARQQTLRNTIDWSYNLLNESEQRLFRRLGVFVGGCTLEAAEEVCGDKETRRQGDRESEGSIQAISLSPCLLVSPSVFDGLAALADKSLLRQEEGLDGEPRFVMLETVREYALERLAANGELEAMQRRHAEYFTALAKTAEPKLRRFDQVAWLNRVEQEHDNLRTMLAWSRDSVNNTDLEITVGAALWRFWDLRGYLAEIRYWLHDVLMKTQGKHTPERGRALLGAGNRAWWDGDYPAATVLIEESLAIFQEQNDQLGRAMALIIKGSVAHDQANYHLAETCYSESLALCQKAGDQRGMADALAALGIIAGFRGDIQRSRTLSASSLTLYREVGDKVGIAEGLNWLASSLEPQGDYDGAEVCWQEALSLLEELDEKPTRAYVLGNLGRLLLFARNDLERAAILTGESHRLFQHVGDVRGNALAIAQLGWIAWVQGKYNQANVHMETSLTELRKLRDQRLIAGVLRLSIWIAHTRSDRHQAFALLGEQIALLQSIGLDNRIHSCLDDCAMLMAVGHAEQATRFLAAAEVLRESLAVRIVPFFSVVNNRTIAAIRAQLDDATFAAAWAEGQQLTLEAAIAEALAGSALDAKESSM